MTCGSRWKHSSAKNWFGVATGSPRVDLNLETHSSLAERSPPAPPKNQPHVNSSALFLGMLDSWGAWGFRFLGGAGAIVFNGRVGVGPHNTLPGHIPSKTYNELDGERRLGTTTDASGVGPIISGFGITNANS